MGKYRIDANRRTLIDVTRFAIEKYEFAKESKAIRMLNEKLKDETVSDKEIEMSMIGLILEKEKAQSELLTAIFSNIEPKEDKHGNAIATLDVALIATEIDELKAIEC